MSFPGCGASIVASDPELGCETSQAPECSTPVASQRVATAHHSTGQRLATVLGCSAGFFEGSQLLEDLSNLRRRRPAESSK